MADDVVLVRDSIAAQHVAAVAGDGEGLGAVVALDEGNHLGRDQVLVLEAAHLQGGLQPQCDLAWAWGRRGGGG